MGTSNNHLIGFLNFLSILLSVPIIGGGVWLSSRANTTDCMKFLQWPLILIGFAVMVVSLAGFAGACYRNTFLMYVYLWAMFFVIATLVGFVVFAYSVTERGSGRPVMNRVYLDYSLQDYSGWLAERVASQRYWSKIGSCIRDSHVCDKLHRYVGGVPESAESFYLRKLTPIQSGCCKPPTSCGYTYMNETFWMSEGGLRGMDPDCVRWSNEQEQLCYGCGSCKAGVLASLKKSWRRVSVINISKNISGISEHLHSRQRPELSPHLLSALQIVSALVVGIPNYLRKDCIQLTLEFLYLEQSANTVLNVEIFECIPCEGPPSARSSKVVDDVGATIQPLKSERRTS